MDLRELFCALSPLIVVLAMGCGESSAPPKANLSEQEKQQVRELNEQRVDEWGKKVK